MAVANNKNLKSRKNNNNLSDGKNLQRNEICQDDIINIDNNKNSTDI